MGEIAKHSDVAPVLPDRWLMCGPREAARGAACLAVAGEPVGGAHALPAQHAARVQPLKQLVVEDLVGGLRAACTAWWQGVTQPGLHTTRR